MSTVTERSVINPGGTAIGVDLVDGHPRVKLRSGLVRAQLLGSTPERTRIGLIANTALLLGGDHVELQIDVGPGVRLEVFEVAGTVAYHGRGMSSSWQVVARVAERADLIMTGEPFVVSAGADVDRSLRLDVAESGSARLREIVVLGRTGEVGGRLRNRTMISAGGVDVLHEDQQLVPDVRRLPGILGGARVIDTITHVAAGVVPTDRPRSGDVATFGLLDSSGSLTRWIGDDLADSPLHRCWP